MDVRVQVRLCAAFGPFARGLLWAREAGRQDDHRTPARLPCEHALRARARAATHSAAHGVGDAEDAVAASHTGAPATISWIS